MNDKFSAQIRQHLLETGDERPGEGQLAAVVDAVARTRQRLPLVARLTWNPGRIGLVPATAVRVGLVVAALALAMAAGAMLAGGPSGPTTVFEGTWTATDPGDNSAMILVVGRGNTPPVYFEDGYATGAACVNDVVKRFTARGNGEISDNRLLAWYPDGGGCGLVTVKIGGRYDYIAASDILLDHDELVWTRALGGKLDATHAPATQEPPESSALPTSADTQTCFEIPAGATYNGNAEALSLTVTIPAAAEFAWQGHRDEFRVDYNCSEGGPFAITASIVDVIFDDCDRHGGSPGSRDEVVDWLANSQDFTASEPAELTIAGYAATRFEVSFESSPCPDDVHPLLQGGAAIGRDAAVIVYIVDVDYGGVPLGVAIINRYGDASAARVAEAEAIVASLKIER
jgi:hypothetical protein